MSAAKSMSISLRRKRGALFEARNATGQTTLIDGPPDLGGQGEGVRPMEAVLIALAGCSAMDVIHILEKQQKEPLEDLDVDVVGQRADAIPAVYTDIEVRFAASGAVDPHKLERAVRLSMEKYCSVSKMLAPTVNITWSVTLKG
jgi:putative redox protein